MFFPFSLARSEREDDDDDDGDGAGRAWLLHDTSAPRSDIINFNFVTASGEGRYRGENCPLAVALFADYPSKSHLIEL